MIIAFFRVLVLYPEVQKRAQKELDTVTGNLLRLPDYTDHPRLPYIDALCRVHEVEYGNACRLVMRLHRWSRK
jgi:hypothetical protein